MILLDWLYHVLLHSTNSISIDFVWKVIFFFSLVPYIFDVFSSNRFSKLKIIIRIKEQNSFHYHDLPPSVLHLDCHPLIVVRIKDPSHGHFLALLHVGHSTHLHQPHSIFCCNIQFKIWWTKSLFRSDLISNTIILYCIKEIWINILSKNSNFCYLQIYGSVHSGIILINIVWIGCSYLEISAPQASPLFW